VKPAAVVSSRDALEAIPVETIPVVMVDDLAASTWDDARLFAERAQAHRGGSEVAFLQHSSGTTGHKKGVMLSHQQVLRQVKSYAKAIGIGETDKIASWLPLYHDMGLITSFILPTILGCSIVSIDALEWVMRPAMLLEYIQRERANYCWLPNFAFHHIVRTDRSNRAYDLSSMKMFVSCSEPCRVAAFETFLTRYKDAHISEGTLHVSYALAENVFAVTQTIRGGLPGGTGVASGYASCGKPVDGAEIEIRSESGEVLAEGEPGEIWFRTNSMFSGYHQLPNLTAQKVRDGWYRTGDVGVMQAGELYVIGRTDDLLIISGKNLMAHELEDVVSAIPGVAPGRVLVAGEYDEASGTQQMIILAETDGSGDADQLVSTIGSVAASTCGISPSKVALLPRGFLVKSTSGKLARAGSFEKYKSQESSGQL
jgi:acyl-CoA synthetase (AMP-forming)/AMP-acid ligase II